MLQLSKEITEITVTEGQAAVEIDFIVNMPPQFICKGKRTEEDECIIRIEGKYIFHKTACKGKVPVLSYRMSQNVEICLCAYFRPM